MIPSVQFQSCNDTLTTIHKDILEKLDMPMTPHLNPDDHHQVSDHQQIQFQSDQILMHPMEFSDSEIALSQDCHSIELETSDEMITTCDDTNNIINYTIIGNGLILIEGSQIDFDDETKDNTNHLRALKGIDLLVAVKNSDEVNEIEEEDKDFDEMHSEADGTSVQMAQDEIADNVETVEPQPNSTETRTAQAPEENCDEDDDDDESSSEHELTNLGWLIDLKNLTQWPQVDTNTTTRKSSSTNSHSALVNGISSCIMNDIDEEDNSAAPVVSEKDLSEERFKKFTIQVKQSQKNYAERERIYKLDPLEKPPFNYAQIIAMAMMDCGRMTLKDICKWIQEHFAYFRYNKNWNNSIRHNLSLHFCFTKIARDKTEKGKGGYWELSMNATKSEKKRVRNRRKHRDDNGRIFQSHRNRLTLRRNTQRSSSATSTKPSDNSIRDKSNPSLNIATNDSCNVSSASDGSSSICSGNGMTDDTKNMWSEINGITNTHFMQSIQSSVNEHEQLDHELISDVITNDLVIINASDLAQSQAIDSYFVDQQLDHESHQHHLPGANGNVLVESNITAAILNDSSNETFIKGGLDQQTNLLSGATITAAASTSNVVVEPMPYSLSHMDTVIDIDHEFGHLVNMPDPELTVDGFFDYGSW